MISPVNPLSTVINIGPAQIYAATHTIPAKYQTAIQANRDRQHDLRTYKYQEKRIHYGKDVGNPRMSINRRDRTVGTTWP